MHPLISDLSNLKDSEVELKINELTKRYFQANSYELKSQITMILDVYREELQHRRHAEWQKMMENRNKDLDKLINID